MQSKTCQFFTAAIVALGVCLICSEADSADGPDETDRKLDQSLIGDKPKADQVLLAINHRRITLKPNRRLLRVRRAKARLTRASRSNSLATTCGSILKTSRS